jgi:hypothetical protein
MAPAVLRQSPGGESTDTLAAWQAVLVELRAIRQLLERDRRPSPLTRRDRDRLALLLPAIGGVFGSELFLTRDVFESEAAALQLVRRGLNAKQVGRLLRRAADTPIDSYMVTRQGTEAGAVLWRLVQVPEFPAMENLSVPHATPRGRL